MLVTGSLAISAVLFDLDETLLDRTTSLRAFLLDQYARFSQRLGRVDGVAPARRGLARGAAAMSGRDDQYPFPGSGSGPGYGLTRPRLAEPEGFPLPARPAAA